ncbi:hypothetical protein BC941DRAFT_499054 [Chlamydoabsidia padenii]|nr:hypothetical protein BC941DRAFT_499054 [Chlamydoabsidia padenii]
MFSLYGDLPAPKSKSDNGESAENTTTSNNNASTTTKPSTAGWSNRQQFRPMMRKPTIQAKPKLFKPVIPAGATIVSTTTVNKQDPVSPPSTSPPPSQIKSSPVLRPLQTKAYFSTKDNVNGFRQNKKQKNKAVQNQGPPPIDLYEDYDPLKPTDYEQYKEEIDIIRRQERRHSYQSDASSRSPSPRRPKRGYAPPPELYNTVSRSPSPPPPPPTNTYIQESGDDAYNRRAMMSQNPPRQTAETPLNTGSAAWKMMNKYGWQEGQGLGRGEDGIREALKVQAHGDGSGVILRQPGRVIVLKNMVEDIDDQLEQETAEECEKYGKVEQCVVHQQGGVKIFIKFAHPQSALDAIHDLNGRYFDGRVVSAELFDQDRFDHMDFALS